MNRDKLRAVLKQERPDLVEAEPAQAVAPASDSAADVDEKAVPAATWARHFPPGAKDMPATIDKTKGLSADEIRKAFAPRKLGTDQAHSTTGAPKTAATDEPNIVRVVKRKGLEAFADSADGSGPKAKDVLVDEERGIIGSQG